MRRPFVYLIRKRGLGDVLWIEPVIRQLASRSKKVIVYTKYPELFLNYPLQNVIIKKDLRFIEKVMWGIERALGTSFFFINLEEAYERRPSVHFLTAYQQAAKLPVVNEYPRLYLNEQELAWRPPVEGRYALIHIDSVTKLNFRKVYGIDWEKVATGLHQRGFHVLQIGHDPVLIPGAIHVQTTTREMMSLIRGAALFIGTDSGPSHLAAAQGVPSLIFFGSVNPAFRHFKELLRGWFLQQPCEFAGCYHDTTRPDWPSCRLVGDNGIPKCNLHTTEYVLNNIDLLIQQFI